MSPELAIEALGRVDTGSRALDRILGGGFPARSVNIIAGAPGSGKTVLALQMIFHLARQGKKCLYFTTLAEPAIKLISYMQYFSFFDPRLLDESVHIVDLGSTVRKCGAEPALSGITDRVERDEPAIVVIDSFKAIGDLLYDAVRARMFVYDLATFLAGWGALTLLVGEYTSQEIATWPEFAVADGILRLKNPSDELAPVREMDVLKLRGADYITGRHFFEITPAGLTIYPRVRAPDPQKDAPRKIDDRASTGVAGLDQLLHGGLPRASTTLIHGGTGTGKTLLGLHMLVEGARRGEAGILFSLEETRSQLCAIAKNFGWDLAALEAQGLLAIVCNAPVELSTDRFLDEACQATERTSARRVVLDSLSSLSLSVPSEQRFKELVYALCKHLQVANATVVLTMEVPELLGSAYHVGHGLSFVADNIIQLRYVEEGGRLARGVSVLKARGMHHETEVRRVTVTATGIVVGARYAMASGVFSGDPEAAEAGAP